MTPRGHGPVRRLLPGAGGSPGPEEAVDREIEHYLEECADALGAGGWPPDEARREAERRFGSRERYRSDLTSMERRRRMMRRTGLVMDFVRTAVAGTLRTVRR